MFFPQKNTFDIRNNPYILKSVYFPLFLVPLLLLKSILQEKNSRVSRMYTRIKKVETSYISGLENLKFSHCFANHDDFIYPSISHVRAAQYMPDKRHVAFATSRSGKIISRRFVRTGITSFSLYHCCAHQNRKQWRFVEFFLPETGYIRRKENSLK